MLAVDESQRTSCPGLAGQTALAEGLRLTQAMGLQFPAASHCRMRGPIDLRAPLGRELVLFFRLVPAPLLLIDTRQVVVYTGIARGQNLRGVQPLLRLGKVVLFQVSRARVVGGVIKRGIRGDLP